MDESRIASFKRIQRLKFMMGIFSAILIASTFAFIFLGFLKVDQGIVSDVGLDNLTVFPRLIDVDMNNQTHEILLFSSRREDMKISGGNNVTYGSNDRNRIVVIDPVTFDLKYNFTLQKPRHVIGFINLANEGNISSGMAPVVLVQYAQVSEEETIVNNSVGTAYIIVKNETGIYETYLLYPAGGQPVNITAAVSGRILSMIPLIYDPADNTPDFLVLSTNITRDNVPNSFVHHYELLAFYANGTRAWVVNNTTPTSAIAPQSTAPFEYGWQFEAPIYHGLELGMLHNKTHFAMNVGASLVMGYIKNGSQAWKSSLASIQVRSIFELAFDKNSDSVPDILVEASIGGDPASYFMYLDGCNGTKLSSPAQIRSSNDAIVHARSVQRFGNAESYIFGLNKTTKVLKIYRHSASGIINYGNVSLAEETDGFVLMPSWSFINDTGRAYYSLIIPRDGDYDLVIIDVESASRVATRQEFYFGDFLVDELAPFDGPEIAIADIYYTYLLLSSMPSKPMWTMSSVNEIAFFVSVGAMIVSGLVLMRARRPVKKALARHAEQMAESDRTAPAVVSPEKVSHGLYVLSSIFLSVIIVAAVIFFIFIFVQTSMNIYRSDVYYTFRNAFITIAIQFASMPLIAILYNLFSASSGMFYIKFQRFVFKAFKRGKKYDVIVLDMNEYGKKFSAWTIFMRSIFPLLVSLTIGITVFGYFSNELLVTPSGTINLRWISDFTFYAGIVFVGSYVVLTLFIPGGWLLDDAGVVYFDEPKSFRQPGDISKISNWMLSLFKGIFGFTALISYYNLFVGADFSSLVGLSSDPVLNLLMFIFIVLVLLILSPILFGFLVMFTSNASILSDLQYNTHRLFIRMKKMGIDTTPRRLSDFFQPRTAS